VSSPDINMWRMAGTVGSEPYLSEVGKVGLFYMKTIRPAKGRRKLMILKIVSFGKTAQRAHQLLKRDMRIECWGQLKTSTFHDKRYIQAGLSKEQAKRWSLELVMRGFNFCSTQWDSDNLTIAMNIACAEDWMETDKKEGDNEGETPEEGGGIAPIGI